MDNDDVVIESDDESLEGEGSTASKLKDKLKSLRETLAKANEEKQQYLDGWQRAKADYVNLSRRSAEQRAEDRTRGITDAVGAFFPAFDALERAKAHGELPPGFQGIVKQLESAATALGLQKIGDDAVGQSFDPAIHEAITAVPTDDEEKDGIVTELLENGWQIGEKVIRPAKVAVARFG